MYEGQQVVEAIFRQTGERIRPKVANIDFNREGVFYFVGTPDTYEGVRNLLALYGVKPDTDPLEAAVILPVNPATGESAGKSGTGLVKPPADNYDDLDDLSDIKALKAQNTDGRTADSASAATGSGEAQDQSAGMQPASAADLQHRSDADSAPRSAERAASGGEHQLRTEASTAESNPIQSGINTVAEDDDADFDFT